MITVTLNNAVVEVEEGSTILDAARKSEVHIPTLCYLNLHDIGMVNQVGTCRVCVVEIDGRRNLAPACSTVVTEGMVIRTNTPRSIMARRKVVELLLSNHPKDCLVCERNRKCELQSLAADLNVRENKYEGRKRQTPIDDSSRSLIRNLDKCVLCRRCETMCNVVQTVGVYSTVHRGFETIMGAAYDMPMSETVCTFCGQCVSVCPTAALTQVSDMSHVWQAISDKEKVVIVQTAPAVRAALGEEFGLPPGERVTGKMVAALRRIGCDHVYDTDFAADLTIMEEANELIKRVTEGGPLPILTSCCPAWVKFIEHQFPELLDIPSSCKSPHEMFGAIAKTYLAKKLNVDPRKMVVVSIMPCVAKKYEAAREELAKDSLANVDYVLSTRELASMIREAGIRFVNLPDEDFDPIMGDSSGAGVIFGATGGVIEAAVRTAASWLTGENITDVDFTQLRGMKGLREATVKIGDLELKIGIASGLGNARTLLENIRDGKADYHAIEIMACPGGCVAGGGQPYYGNDREIIKKRAEAIYAEDKGKPVRLSHENEEIKKLYAEFLEKPGSHIAHELLHTEFSKRELV
ncbi:MAG: [FeFe] hydrogenase, group A [Clostridiales bacterium]|jgi:iron-only hydrogenase group A|nr:[FeFe] hydrogenase, group A [Clostridiales bacterium]